MSVLALESMPSGGFRPPAPPRPPRDLSTLGVALALGRNSLTAWPERAYEELILRRRFLGVDCILVNDPEAARLVLRDRPDIYVRPVAMMRLLGPCTGEGLLLADGEAWKAQRRMVASHFSPAAVETALPAIQAASQALVDALPASGLADLGAELERTAIDSVGRVLFSTPLRERASHIGGMLRAYFRGSAKGTVWDFVARQIGDHAWAHGERVAWSRSWFAEVDALIAGRLGRGPDDGSDLFSHLRREDPEGFRDQVATMLAAGFESTARTLFWASYLLSQDQPEQDAVRAELTRVHPAEIRTLADLKAWPRLTHVVQETLRLYPTVSALARTALANDELPGVSVSRGAFVIICPWVMHRHRAHWDRPDDFMPDRFAGQSGRLRDGTYLPFGLGRRICIGATVAQVETTLILANLLARWRVTLDSDRPVLPVAVTTTVPDHEPPFRLTPVAA